MDRQSPAIVPSLRDVAEALAEWEEQATAADNRAAFRRARRALAQASPGRPQLDDRRLLADACSLIESGRAKSAWQAFQLVARAVDPFGNTRSIAERLRRKHAQQTNKSTK